MRRTGMAFVAAVVLLAGGVVAQQKRQQDIDLQAAIRTETVDGDLNGAIKQYGAIISKYRADRAVTATALLHLAECYQKLGDAQSQSFYERIVTDYADQKEAFALARSRLVRPNVSARVSGTARYRQVWTGPEVDVEGGVSPDGRYLSFVDWATGDLALRDLAAGTNRRLTNKGTWEHSGEYAEWSAISRDGKQVAYSWFKNRYQLRVIGLQGSGVSQPRTLFDNEDVEEIAPHDWSPDGRRIAVQVKRQDRTTQIGWVAIEDGALHVVRSVDWRGTTRIAYSPDGNYLAFDLPLSETGEQRDLFVVTSDGRSQSAAGMNAGQNRVIGWSPDGTRLLFISDRGGSAGIWSLTTTNPAPADPPFCCLFPSRVASRGSCCA